MARGAGPEKFEGSPGGDQGEREPGKKVDRRLLVAWHKGHEVKVPPDLEMTILQVAEHYHVLPDQVEQMDVYWFNRTIINLKAKAEAKNEQ
jgi:hypothetical protein